MRPAETGTAAFIGSSLAAPTLSHARSAHTGGERVRESEREREIGRESAVYSSSGLRSPFKLAPPIFAVSSADCQPYLELYEEHHSLPSWKHTQWCSETLFMVVAWSRVLQEAIVQ